MGQGKPCPHCGGEGTCKRVGPQDSCTECLEHYARQVENASALRLVPCSFCGGSGRFLADEKYLTCAHCQGSRFCLPHGDKAGCDFCLEIHREGLIGRDALRPIVMVPCTCCQGTGIIRGEPIAVGTAVSITAPEPKVKVRPAKQPKVKPVASQRERPTRRRFGWLGLTLLFFLMFSAAFTGVFWIFGLIRSGARTATAGLEDVRESNVSQALRVDDLLIIHSDLSVSIEETMIIRMKTPTHFQLKRDLFTDSLIPTDNKKVLPEMFMESVELNGESTPFQLDKTDAGRSFVIGSKNPLPSGVNTITIRYRLKNLVQTTDDAYQLHWNVMSKDWPFPTAQASATVGLPLNLKPDLNRVETDAGIGIWGAKDYQATVDDEANVGFAATRALKPRETFQITVGWPKSQPRTDIKEKGQV